MYYRGASVATGLPTTLSIASFAPCTFFTSCTLIRRVPAFSYTLNRRGCACTALEEAVLLIRDEGADERALLQHHLLQPHALAQPTQADGFHQLRDLLRDRAETVGDLRRELLQLGFVLDVVELSE